MRPGALNAIFSVSWLIILGFGGRGVGITIRIRSFIPTVFLFLGSLLLGRSRCGGGGGGGGGGGWTCWFHQRRSMLISANAGANNNCITGRYVGR